MGVGPPPPPLLGTAPTCPNWLTHRLRIAIASATLTGLHKFQRSGRAPLRDTRLSPPPSTSRLLLSHPHSRCFPISLHLSFVPPVPLQLSAGVLHTYSQRSRVNKYPSFALHAQRSRSTGVLRREPRHTSFAVTLAPRRHQACSASQRRHRLPPYKGQLRPLSSCQTRIPC